MAITKTTTVARIEVYPPKNTSAPDSSNENHETVFVVYDDVLDDPNDADLPILSSRPKHFSKFEDDGSATDVSGEDALVQTICTAVWS